MLSYVSGSPFRSPTSRVGTWGCTAISPRIAIMMSSFLEAASWSCAAPVTAYTLKTMMDAPPPRSRMEAIARPASNTSRVLAVFGVRGKDRFGARTTEATPPNTLPPPGVVGLKAPCHPAALSLAVMPGCLLRGMVCSWQNTADTSRETSQENAVSICVRFETRILVRGPGCGSIPCSLKREYFCAASLSEMPKIATSRGRLTVIPIFLGGCPLKSDITATVQLAPPSTVTGLGAPAAFRCSPQTNSKVTYSGVLTDLQGCLFE